MADGVALLGGHQIYLAEVSLIYEPKLDKQAKDKFKLARCMRDSWNCQIRSIAREAVPPAGLSVFGSTSFGDETKKSSAMDADDPNDDSFKGLTKAAFDDHRTIRDFLQRAHAPLDKSSTRVNSIRTDRMLSSANR
ncbi:hypothetical protein BGX33_005280 [Mortierella sp. NVP41]|nr:hypothetical protein BGX33_005280 [Mortierella sp. NVP41]